MLQGPLGSLGLALRLQTQSGNRMLAAADGCSHGQTSCQTVLKQDTHPALGKDGSQISTAMQSSGTVFPLGGKELLLLTKAGLLLTFLPSTIQTILPLIILPAKLLGAFQILPVLSYWC